MEYEIDEIDVLLDPSTNPSLIHRRRTERLNHSRLSSWNRKTIRRRALTIPDED